jgi:hypothetical protein
MRRYSDDEEERIRAQGMVREWTRSGLLDAAQGARLGAELSVELRRTNPFLRAGLALFTGLIVAASVALAVEFFELRDEAAIATITGIAAAVCIGLAEYLVVEFRCYRFGVEEALAVAAVALLGISGVELTSWLHTGLRGLPAVVGLLVGAAGGFGLYRRFGFVYAAFGSIVCTAAIPFQLDLSATTQRVLAAAAMASLFAAARWQRLKHRDGYPGDEYGLLQAAAFAGVYLALNVFWSAPVTHAGEYLVSSGLRRVDQFFYWCTYGAIWALPLMGLRLGIRAKDRDLMDVSLVLALITLLTNKPYLGWPRHTWDASLLGAVLIAIAIAVRRWLSRGPGGERNGFTAVRLLDRDRAVLSLVSTASVLVQPGVAPSRTEPAASEFSGGRSGGGGGGDSF